MDKKKRKLNKWQVLFFRFLKENNAYYKYTSLTQGNIWDVFEHANIDSYVCSHYKGWDYDYNNYFWKTVDLKWVIFMFDNYHRTPCLPKSFLAEIIRQVISDGDIPLDEDLGKKCMNILLKYKFS